MMPADIEQKAVESAPDFLGDEVPDFDAQQWGEAGTVFSDPESEQGWIKVENDDKLEPLRR